MPRSLFGQLVVSQILVMLAVGAVLAILLVHVLNSTADQFVSARLTRNAQAIAAGHAPDTSIADSNNSVFGSPQADAGNGQRFAVFTLNGAVIRRSAHALPLSFSRIERGPRPIFFREGQYDILSLPAIGADRQPQWVVVAQDRTVPNEIVDDVVAAFLSRFVWMMPASLLASLVVGLLVVRRVTGKFRHTAAQADAISLHRLDVRLKPEDVPSEAAPLVKATNRALDRLEVGYRFQGEFVGNVAHELRTPLALISLRAESLDPSLERDMILLGVERANHVVRQLMELAAIDRHYPQVVEFDPCGLAAEIVGTMAPLVFQADHDIAFVEPEQALPSVEGVPGLLQIALTNLIDNAVRHTPAGCTVTVSIELDGAIVVGDDGPGMAVDAGDGSQLRFRREDTKRSDSAGLGLAIVQRIMTVCGGTLETGNGPKGGARCTMRFRAPQPLAAPDNG